MSDLPEPTDGLDDDEMRAAEHALGLGDDQERARGRALRISDPAFDARVAAWESRFAPLFDEARPAPPPPELWDRIAASVIPVSRAAPLRRPASPWNRAGPWRVATGLSLAAALTGLVVILWRPAGPTGASAPTAGAGSTIKVATLASPDGRALFKVSLDWARAQATVIPVSGVRDRDRFPELWIIPAGGQPRAIGMIAGSRAATVPVSGAAVADSGGQAVLAVSLEPAGGSPTGAPTGPVIATGPLKSL